MRYYLLVNGNYFNDGDLLRILFFQSIRNTQLSDKMHYLPMITHHLPRDIFILRCLKIFFFFFCSKWTENIIFRLSSKNKKKKFFSKKFVTTFGQKGPPLPQKMNFFCLNKFRYHTIRLDEKITNIIFLLSKTFKKRLFKVKLKKN